MGALRPGSSCPTTCWRTAWGSMDRYHLAWLSVGKPKEIVRGRPMTAGRGGGLRPRGGEPEDGRAADEPRRRGAAGDAVPRRDRRRRRRGRAAGRRRRGRCDRATATRPDCPRDPTACAERLAAGRAREADAHRDDGPTRRGAPPGADAAMTATARDRPGRRAARARSPCPTRSPATTCSSRCGSTSTSRASSTATSARRAEGPGRHGAAPRAGRLADDAAALRERLADRGRRARPAPLAGRPARRARGAGRGAGRRRACRTWSIVTRCFDSAPAAPDDAVFDAARGATRRAAARRCAAGRPARRLGPTPRRSGSIGCRAVIDWLVEPVPRRCGGALRPARRRGPPGGSRSSATSRGAATTGTTAAGARGSTSTPTCRSAPRTCCGSSPTRPTPATTSSTPGTRPTSSTTWAAWRRRVLRINTPECLLSEGLADLGRRFAVPPADEAALLVELFERAGLPVARRPGGGPRDRRALRRDRRGPHGPSARPAATPRSCSTPTARRARRSSPTSRGRRLHARTRRQAARVHRASAVADVRLRLRRGRGDAAPVGRCRAGSRIASPVSAGCSTSRSRRAPSSRRSHLADEDRPDRRPARRSPGGPGSRRSAWCRARHPPGTPSRGGSRPRRDCPARSRPSPAAHRARQGPRTLARTTRARCPTSGDWDRSRSYGHSPRSDRRG